MNRPDPTPGPPAQRDAGAARTAPGLTVYMTVVMGLLVLLRAAPIGSSLRAPPPE